MPDFCSLIERFNFISFAFQIPLPSSCHLDTLESIKMLPHHRIYRHDSFVHADPDTEVFSATGKAEQTHTK